MTAPTSVPDRLPVRVSVDVLLFASAAEALGRSSLALELPAGANAGDVLAAVRAAARDASGTELPSSCRLAVNQAFAADDDVVRPGDELAVIPPVAGG